MLDTMSQKKHCYDMTFTNMKRHEHISKMYGRQSFQSKKWNKITDVLNCSSNTSSNLIKWIQNELDANLKRSGIKNNYTDHPFASRSAPK